jgi:fumarate hydratase class II
MSANNLEIRKETDSLGEVDLPAAKLWGAQTQRSLEHFRTAQVAEEIGVAPLLDQLGSKDTLT